MSTSNNPPKLLAGIGQQIHSHFINLERLVGKSDVIKKEASNEQQRFQLWARNLGLYHSGHSSLDYRLRDSIILFDYTVGLLRDLRTTISELQHKLKENTTRSEEPEYNSDLVHSQGESNSISESDSDENLSSYEDEPMPIVLLNSITSIIDRLYRLAFKIRNPRIRIGLIGTFLSFHNHSNAESDLITCLRTSDAARIQDLLRFYNPAHDSEKMKFLIQRLVDANAHRRRQFEYWRHRREQYEAQSNFELTGVAASISQPATASALDPKKVDLNESISSASTDTSLKSAIEGSDLYATVPKPPPLEAGVKEFECPYCYTLLSSTTQRKDKWEVHIYRDLRPYICTFEDCKDPDQQYDSFHDWVAHETSTHMSSAANKEFRPVLRSARPTDTLSTSTFSRKCPFCEYQAASVAHIASHLRRIACFALPSTESNEIQDERSLPASEEAVVDSDSSEESLPRIADEANNLSRSFTTPHKENFSWGAFSRRVSQLDSNFGETPQFKSEKFKTPSIDEAPSVSQAPPTSQSPSVHQAPLSPVDALPDYHAVGKESNRSWFFPGIAVEGPPRSTVPELEFPLVDLPGAWTRYPPWSPSQEKRPTPASWNLYREQSRNLGPWFCCECNFGPQTSELHETCINCERKRCPNCVASNIKEEY